MNHYKSLAIFSKDLAVVSQSNKIENIVIVQEGIDKNGGFFTREFIDGLIEAGNSQKQGVKCRFGHPNMCKTSLGTFVGRFSNFRSEDDNGVYKAIADLTLAEIAKDTMAEGLGISYFDYIMKMASENPDMFGNSIVFSSDCEYPEVEIGGEMFLVEKYLLPINLIASDLVDSPAATDELFKSSGDLGVMVTSFLDEHPEIFEAVQKDESLIGNFLVRYEQYKTKKKNMNFLKKLLSKSTQKDIEQTLGNGDVVTVITDAQEAKVGDKVVDANNSPLADGEHVLPDGSKWVIVGGEISEIIPVAVPDASSEEEQGEKETEPTSTEKQILKSVNDLAEKFENFMKETNANLEGVAEKVLEVQEKQTTLAKSVKSTYKAPKAEAKDIKNPSEMSFMDRVEQQRLEKEENRK